jgi:hypothetical protein
MFSNNNPLLIEKLVRSQQEEIMQEVQKENRLSGFRAKVEILIILILVAALLWFFL